MPCLNPPRPTLSRRRGIFCFALNSYRAFIIFCQRSARNYELAYWFALLTPNHAFLLPFSSFRCIFSSEDIQHPPVRWTTSKWSCISIPFSPRLRDHRVGGCVILVQWSSLVHVSLLCRGAAKLQYSHHLSHVFGRRARVCWFPTRSELSFSWRIILFIIFSITLGCVLLGVLSGVYVPGTQWTILQLKDNFVHHFSHNFGMCALGGA